MMYDVSLVAFRSAKGSSCGGARTMKSLEGQLLIASNELRDPNFLRTVVLIFRHDDEGAAGLVLNRRLNATLRQIWKQVSQQPCRCEAALYLGGPVEGPLMAIHTEGELSEIEIVEGLFFSAGGENLAQLVDAEQPMARFFVGYAGWGAGQLEREMDEGAWLTAPATAERVFGDIDELWQRVTREATSSALISTLKIKHVPKHPWMN
jgi:putative transcriptional regulator